MKEKVGALYVVGTPIGNLGDITLRAIETLKGVDLVLCEDTRETKKLLSHFDIHKLTQAYHAQSKLSKIDDIIEMLREGKSLALVSDAGTPTISDPGVLLVKEIRAQLPEARIVPIPGPSALVTALSVSGLPASEFTFLGFIPHKKGRETLFKYIRVSDRTVVCYESPHRIEKTLVSLCEHLEPERTVVIGRELTKMYEQIISGNPAEIKAFFDEHQEAVRGEFVVIIGPAL